MKKALTEADASELEARLAAVEAKLEKLSPTAPLKVREPYAVGRNVFSRQDLEARNPFLVRGYRNGRILVETVPGEPARELPIESVVAWEQCPRAETNTERAYDQQYASMDETSRAFYAGRRAAQLAANTRPPKTFIEKLEERYAGR